MIDTVNASEQFVYNVCRKSFLSLWSYPNPQGKNSSKELCDILIVCDPYIIVLSVKENSLNTSGDMSVSQARWQRKAVDKSITQIKTALRFLNRSTYVTPKKSSLNIALPPHNRRVYYRIAVAFGSQRELHIKSFYEKEHGFFHVMDEKSFFLILRHLDTVSDLVRYLQEKERYLTETTVLVGGGEENLLAIYLHNNRQFPPEKADYLILEDNTWNQFSQKPEFCEKLKQDQYSYIWDQLIEELSINNKSPWETEGDDIGMEQVFRIMALEDRFSRRSLGKALKEFFSAEKKIEARYIKSLNNIGYVFFCYEKNSTANERKSILLDRCFASLYQFPNCYTIVGIGLNFPEEISKYGYTPTVILLQTDNNGWSQEYWQHAKVCRDEFGYFKDPIKTFSHEEEYPQSQI